MKHVLLEVTYSYSSHQVPFILSENTSKDAIVSLKTNIRCFSYKKNNHQDNLNLNILLFHLFIFLYLC